MADCTDPIPLENLDFCEANDGLPGISETDIHASLLDDFDTVEYVPEYADGTDFKTLGTISVAHTFKTDKGFHKITARVDTGLVDGAQVGEKGTLAINNSFTFTVPSTDARTVGWTRKHINRPMIFVVTERSGKKKQIGSKLSPAYLMEITPTSGQTAGDPKGVTFKITDAQMHHAPEYDATIELFPTPTP